MRLLHRLLVIATFSIVNPSNASVHPIAAEPFLNVNKQPTFADAISLPIANQNANYSGTYLFHHARVERNNLNRSRLTLNQNDGMVWYPFGSSVVNLSTDSQGFLTLSLQQPLLEKEVRTTVADKDARLHLYINKLKFYPEQLTNEHIEFRVLIQYKNVYPDGESEDYTLWKSDTYFGVNAENQLNVANILPLNKRFNIPLEQKSTTTVDYGDGITGPVYVTNDSYFVTLDNKTATNGSGLWQYLSVTESGQQQLQTENVDVEFNDDGSATFTGQSGLTAKVNAYVRQGDNTPLLNTVFYQIGAPFNEHKLAVESHFAIKNPELVHQVPGVYLVKYNTAKFSRDGDYYYWIELNDDGTAALAQPLTFPIDGTPPPIKVTPYRWAYTETEQGTAVELRRYSYLEASGRSGTCMPEQFYPPQYSDCVVSQSQYLDFYDSENLHGEVVINAEQRLVEYGNHYQAQNSNQDVISAISVGTRYFYPLAQRPFPLPEHPVNDNFSAAIALQNQPARITATTVNATPEAGEPCHRMFNCNTGSVWYRYTAQRTGTLRLEAPPPQVTPDLQVYTGTVLSTLTPLSESVYFHDNVVWQAEIEAGTTVHIAVAQNVGQTSEFDLVWQFSAANSTAIADVPLLDNTLKQCVLDTGVSYAEEITEFKCYGVVDPTGLEYFVNLKRLWLIGRYFGPNDRRVLHDLTPITRLKNLKELYLYENELTDSTLASLSSLKFNNADIFAHLSLGKNQLTKDAIPTIVQILTSAQRVTLILEENKFTHFDGLEQLSTINNLYLGKNPISNVPATVNLLYNAPALTFLSLRMLNLQNLDNITLPANLRTLDLSENPISALAAIVDTISSTVITNLALTHTNISDASALSRLNLSNLQLDYSNVSDLSFLANMSTLRYLGINHTNVSSLKPLLNLPNLDIVSMEGNPQFNCNEMINFQNSRPDVLLVNNQLDGFCRFHSGNSFRLTKVRGNYDVSHVEFSAWDGIDYSQYGSITWENGMLTFIPHPGVTGPVTLKIVVTTVEGYTFEYSLRFNIEPVRQSKRRSLPKWLYLMGNN